MYVCRKNRKPKIGKVTKQIVMADLVYFKCVKEGKKLRIKIVSPGYNPNANCQFPSKIRIEGHRYAAPIEAVSFARGPGGTFFYRVKAAAVKVVDEVPAQAPPRLVTIDKIYKAGDEGETECLICFSAEQDVVFAPCGHFCSCHDCANRIFATTGNCPVCRSKIEVVCTMDMIQT